MAEPAASKDAKKAKPNELDFNRPTSDYIKNVEEFGGKLETIADWLGGFFSLIDDFTSLIDGLEDLVDSLGGLGGLGLGGTGGTGTGGTGTGGTGTGGTGGTGTGGTGGTGTGGTGGTGTGGTGGTGTGGTGTGGNNGEPGIKVIETEDWSKVSKDADSEIMTIIRQLEEDYRAGRHDIRFKGVADRDGIQQFRSDNANTNRLFNLVYDALVAKYPNQPSTNHGATIKDSPKSKAIHFMDNIVSNYLSKGISLTRCFVNMEQILAQIQRSHCIADMVNNGHINILVNACPPTEFIEFNNRISEETPVLAAALQSIKTTDKAGYEDIASFTNSKTIVTANKVTVGDDVYETNENAIAVKSFTDFINELSDNNYEAQIDSISEIERTIFSLTKECAIKKIYGTYTAFVSKYNEHEGLIKATYKLLRYAKLNNDSQLMNEILTSSIGPTIKYDFEHIDKIAIDAFRIDENIGEQKYLELFKDINIALTNVNENWNSTNINGIDYPSVDLINNPLIGDLYEINAVNKDIDSIADIPDVSNDDLLLAAIKLKGGDTMNSLSKSFPELNLAA
jgi:hypothetical protein